MLCNIDSKKRVEYLSIISNFKDIYVLIWPKFAPNAKPIEKNEFNQI